MKRLLSLLVLGWLACGVQAQALKETEPEAPCNLPKETQSAVAQPQTEKTALPQDTYKRFRARNKQIRKLTRQYRKAKTAEKKAQIKAQLLQIVSEATDEGLVWSKERIAAERANLNRWEEKIKEQETHLDEVKAQRVEDILSGEAERRHKLAQQRWKREIRDSKKLMK